MDHLLIRSPEAIALRGVVAIALGFVALLLPGPTFLASARFCWPWRSVCDMRVRYQCLPRRQNPAKGSLDI
jgi:hypothetical protein